EVAGNAQFWRGLSVNGPVSIKSDSSSNGITPLLSIAGDATISGTLSLAPQTEAYAGTCNAASEGEMYYDNAQNKYYFCDGSGTWQAVGAGAASAAGTDGAVQYNNGGTMGGATGLYYDDVNARVGIGTTAPGYQLDVAGKTAAFNSEQDGTVGSWSTTSTLPLAISTHNSVVANGYAYVIGGANGANELTSVYYSRINSNGTIGSWTLTSTLPETRNFMTSVAANGYIYVIGGSNSAGTAQSTVYYARINSDGTVGSWNQTTILPQRINELAAVTANGYIYVIGGYDGSNDKSSVYYARLNANGTVGAWNTTTILPRTRSVHSSVVANGYLYVIGGYDGSDVESTVYYAKLNASGTVEAWSTTTILPQGRYAHTSTVANGYLYVLGGIDTSNKSIVYYAKLNTNGTVGSWNQTTILPAALRRTSSLVANGYIYYIGGYTGSADVTTVYYTSLARISMAGTLDLLGLTSESLTNSAGAAAGTIYAGDVYSNNNLEVAGNAQFWRGLSVNGPVSIKPDSSSNGITPLLSIAGDATISGTLSLAPQTEAYAGTCNAASEGEMYYDNAQNKYYFCNGSSWGAISSGGNPAGNDGEVQYNNGGTFGGAAGLYYKDTTGYVGIGTTDPNQSLEVVGTLRLDGATSGYTDIKSNAAPTSYTITLPANGGVNGQVLATNGSGTLTWQNNGGGASTQWTTVGSYIYFDGPVAIGVTNPNAAKLKVSGNFELDNTTTAPSDSAADGTLRIGSLGAGANGGRIWVRSNSGKWFRFLSAGNSASDYSEFIAQSEPSEPGDVMILNATMSATVQKSKSAYDQNILGVITTTGTSNNNGNCWDEVSCDRTNDPAWANVGMLGQVPVKVTTENGPIAVGDRLTTSTKVGVAMKATQASQVIGQAMEAYADPDPNAVGKVMTLVSPSYYDPEVDGTEVDITQLQATAENLTPYETRIPFASTSGSAANSNLGKFTIQGIGSELVKNFQAITNAVTANLKAGSIQSQEVSTQNLTATQGTLNNLSVNNLTAGDSSAIAITLADTDRLVINNGLGETGISMDNQGNATFAGQVTANSLVSNLGSLGTLTVSTDATISGTLRVDRIEAKEIIGLDATLSKLIADTISTRLMTSTSSANLPLDQDSPPSTPAGSLAEESSSSANLGDLGDLSGLDSLTSFDLIATDSADTVIFDQAVRILKSTSLADTSIAGTLLVDGGIQISGTEISTIADQPLSLSSGTTLSLQPLGNGRVEIMAGKVTIDSTGTVTITGDLAVSGSVLAGQAQFEKLSIGPIQEIPAATQAAQTNPNKATAGTATILAGKTQAVIYSQGVSGSSLIYITPTTSTGGQVPYVSVKIPCLDPTDLTCVPSFKVDIDQPVDRDIKFNWWVIN
ncbi:MAG: Cell wall surface anchor family protein, partial [Microgenomates group bacterium GW2011_GWB1_44_8]